MTTLKPIQQGFAAGEISPRMSARSDTDGYHQAASFLENWVPYSHGPIEMRGGFQYKADLTEDYARVFPFYVNPTEGYIISIDVDQVTVLRDDVIQATFPSVWTSVEQLELLQYVMPPSAEHMYFFNPDVAPQRLTYDPVADDWDFEIIPLIDPGAESDVTWEDGNWPKAATFFQGRMWLAGINSHPEAFWGSESGNFYNFALPASDPEPSDPMEFILSK